MSGDGNHPGYILGCWLRDYAYQARIKPTPR